MRLPFILILAVFFLSDLVSEGIAATTFKDGVISPGSIVGSSDKSNAAEEYSQILSDVIPKSPQIILSSTPCEDILESETPWKVKRDGKWVPEFTYEGVRGHCRVIGKLSGKQKFEDQSIWHVPFNIWTRPSADGLLEVISLAHDKPFPGNKKTHEPGLTHLFRIKLDINEAFQSQTMSVERISHWPVPFSYRRVHLRDIDNDGNGELVILGSKEDGRGPVDGPASNMFDQNYIIDFETSKITPFGIAQFSHELLLNDLDGDAHPEILDLGFTNFNGGRGTWVCDGKTLNCKWNRQTDFGANNADLKFELATRKKLLVADCGHRYVKHNKGDSLCWFEVTYDKKRQRLKTKLISKYINLYNAEAKLLNFMGEKKKIPGWKVEGKKIDEEFLMGKRGYHTSLIDLDADGDLDTINYVASMHCKKTDKSRDHYTYADCEKHTVYHDIFIQKDGEFLRQKPNEFEMDNPSYHRYQEVDINDDGLNDIYNYGILRHGVKSINDCYDPMKMTLINRGRGLFETVDRDQIVGRYGCEIASHFFDHKKHSFRLFMAHKSSRDIGDEEETYLALEYLGKELDTIIDYSEETVCDRSTTFKFANGESQKVFSSFKSDERWVKLAKANGYSCGVGKTQTKLRNTYTSASDERVCIGVNNGDISARDEAATRKLTCGIDEVSSQANTTDTDEINAFAEPLEKAKFACTDLGFQPGTGKHGDCVMKLLDY